jgi:hypothetical protein
MNDGKWVIKIHPSDPGVWRGILDLTPAVSEALGHNGFEKVNMWVISIPRPARKAKRSNAIATVWGISGPLPSIS